MTAEQFLNSIRGLDCEITALEAERVRMTERRRDLLDQAENIGAALSGVSVRHGVSSKVESIGIQLADLPVDITKRLNDYQRRINRQIDLLVDRKQVALDTIERIEDARYRALLTLRYINGYKWVTIADMMGYTDTYLRDDLKIQALAAFTTLWQNYRQKPTDIFAKQC
ncbi:MAG: hypothetical protein PHX74_01875 [Candidatus Sumerlaeales bacterium]|nr:hypothetical protein [Candidatus Sumerlaeales bacterium]